MKKIITVLVALAVLALVMATAACPATPPTTPPPATTPGGSPPGPGSLPVAKSPSGKLTLAVAPITDGAAEQMTKCTAYTTPGAELTIQLTNPVTGTISSRPVVKTKVAGADGVVVWEWDIPRQVAKGTGEIKVTAKLGGEEVVQTAAYIMVKSEY
jgi:hypothetical protein